MRLHRKTKRLRVVDETSAKGNQFCPLASFPGPSDASRRRRSGHLSCPALERFVQIPVRLQSIQNFGEVFNDRQRRKSAVYRRLERTGFFTTWNVISPIHNIWIFAGLMSPGPPSA